ncbi:LPXTG cell wall anchor domain-containing protein [Enterococcus sp. AZ109]|uniref:LPXTG cell wall anchor domain-containing protein n=1 Tax=Enterococcus sp. AZ109 TaxID=2774634 RepID=UPI003F247A42
MIKKSVYLFSVAMLGVAIFPTSAFASEATPEMPAPSVVTTEFVESPAVVSEFPVTDVEQPVAPEAAVVPAQVTPVEQPTATDSVTEPVAAETVATPEVPAAAGSVASAPTVEEPQTRAATFPLANDNDGKITDHEKAITDENAKISAEYNFMPNFDNLDDILVDAGGATYSENSYQFVFQLDTAAPGTITVTYKNVGTYNGKVIDMKVTVKDWTVFTGSRYQPTISIRKTNGITMRGISDVLMGYSFLDNLTANAVNVSGFFNFTDIDLNQSIDIFDNNNLQNFYVTKGNNLYYKSHNGYIKIGEINNDSSTNNNVNHWITYTYKDISNFDIRFNQYRETGAVFDYSYQAPVVIEGVTPEPSTPVEQEVPTTVPAKEEAKVTALTSTPAPAKGAEIVKIEPVEVKKASLPQTNEKVSSLFTTIGAACIFLFLSILSNRKVKKD